MQHLYHFLINILIAALDHIMALHANRFDQPTNNLLQMHIYTRKLVTLQPPASLDSKTASTGGISSAPCSQNPPVDAASKADATS